MSATATKRQGTAKKSSKCLTCPKKAVTRGLCEACYMAAYRAIKAGKVTEEEALASKLILPPEQGRWAKQAARKARSA